MTRKLLKVSIVVFSIMILTLSCADKLKDLKTETETQANEINTALAVVKEDGNQLVNEARKLLLTKDTFNESIEDMDKSNGGNFELINGYYIYKSNLLHSLNVPPNTKPQDKEIKELKLMTKLLINMEEIYKKRGYYDSINYLGYSDIINGLSINVTYPEFDMISTMPPPDKLLAFVGGSMRNMPFFAMVTKKNNPDKKGLWMKDLWVNITAKGIYLEYSIPLYITENDDDCYAAFTLPIEIEKFNEIFLANKEELYILVNSLENVWGASKIAINVLGIQLPFFDYLTSAGIKQLGDTFKLKSYDDPGLKELGEKILAGETEFEVTIKGIKYIVAVSDIPEVKSKLIGLVKK